MSKVRVRKYKGDRALQRGVSRMGRHGWVVQSQSSRKAAFSLLAGLFTRKQIHTVTFVRSDQ